MKKILTIAICLLLSLVMFGCGDTPTEPVTDGVTEPKTEETIDVSGVTLADKSVDYDGNEHTLEVTGNIPEGVIVTYLGNKQTEPGDYTVVAILSDKNLNVLSRLEAILTIVSLVPTSGYHLVVNGVTYIPLVQNGAPMDSSFTEYFADNATFETGDVITLYNADANNGAGEGWAIQNPDSFSSGSWTGGTEGITCNTAGTYDVYVKMKYGEDTIYFGPAN